MLLVIKTGLAPVFLISFNVILEHAWNEPQGTGEISIIDNITCLHASYYPRVYEPGYKIRVRYVG